MARPVARTNLHLARMESGVYVHLESKEQLAPRLDADVLAWYRVLGTGRQTRMIAVLKAYRNATA